ncbi:MAG: hypothetical protein FWH57_03065 [Oscillospiraceae bacterium]|nr:hypothetical protein [Oscillospiraceae bacterium]
MRDEDGYIVVETIGAFVPFLLLVVSILSLVNIVALQARVHYAMTQTANTLSMYSYTLEVLGVANSLTTLSDKANKASGKAHEFKKNINGVISGIESFSDIGGAMEQGNAALNQVKDSLADPKALLQEIMNYSIEELRNLAFEQLARPLVGRYLTNEHFSGEEYLILMGVVKSSADRSALSAVGLNALDFYKFSNMGRGNSVLIDAKGNVKLVVEYEILYKFGALPLPFRPTLKVSQTVITKAWLNGSGKGYW